MLGSRYVKGGGVEDWGLVRRLISRGGGLYARTILGVPIHDLTGGFKCIHRRVLEAIDLETIRAEGYVFQIEVTYRALLAGFRVAEIPIVFKRPQRRLEQDVGTDRARGHVGRAVPCAGRGGRRENAGIGQIRERVISQRPRRGEVARETTRVPEHCERKFPNVMSTMTTRRATVRRASYKR